MSDNPTPDDIAALRERLAKVRRERPEAKSGGGGGGNNGAFNSALGMGLRIGLELIVAVIFGGGLGWLVDLGLGTKPWVMLVGGILGFAAGVINVFRAMNGLGMAAGYRPATPPTPVRDEDEED